MRSLRLLPLLLLALLAVPSLRAGLYGDPFTRDASVRENIYYHEVLDDIVLTDPDSTTGQQSKLTVSATASMIGIDPATISGTTEVLIQIGSNILFDATLDTADDSGSGYAQWNIIESDPVTWDDVPSGYILVKWDSSKVTATVSGTGRSLDSALICEAGPIHGTEADDQGVQVSAAFAFAGHSIEDRICWTTEYDTYVRTRANGDDLYNTLCDGNLDNQKPTIGFTSPANNFKVYVPSVDLSGTADDDHTVSNVYISVNGSNYTANGMDFWSYTGLPLVSGTNVIRVYAEDQDDNASTVVTRNVIYSTKSPLGISIVGQGSLTPDLSGSTQQETNVAVTVTAVPAAGWNFAGWTGAVTSGSATITFIQQPNTQLTATFTPGPFVAPAGSYDGLVQTALITPKKCGFIDSTSVSATGDISGSLHFAGVTYKIKGAFDSAGNFTQKIPRTGALPALKLALNLDLANFQDQITGTLTSTGISANIKLNHLVWSSSKNPAPQAGNYTLVLPANPANTSASFPQGDGFGTATIGTGGSATINLTLADGTIATIKSHVSKDGKCPVYASLNKGVLIGEWTFRDQAGISDFDGVTTWRRLPNLTAKNFKKGFNTTLPVVGSKYVVPASGVRIFPNNAGTGSIEIGAGGLPAPITKAITTGTNNLITITDPGADQLAITVNTSKGLFSGTFFQGTAARTVNGAILQKQNAGSGFFLSGKQCGYIDIHTP